MDTDSRHFGIKTYLYGSIILEKCSSRNERAVIQKLLDNGVDGIILPPQLSDSSTVTETLRRIGLPLIGVATGRLKDVGLSVSINNAEAAAAMTHYLISLGHRKLGFIIGASNQKASLERYAGFKLALKEVGLNTRPEWVKRGSFNYRSGSFAAEKILRGSDRPSVIFASNDDMAAGAMAVAHKLHLEVPSELTVVGFDDTPLATAIRPALTTIHQPVAAMARRALELLLEEIQQQIKRKASAPQHYVCKFSLVKRE